MSTLGASSVATRIGVAIYCLSALSFSFELFSQITGYAPVRISWRTHELIQLGTLLGFLVGGILIWRGHVRLARRNQEVEQHLRAAQGEFFAMVETQFDRWQLSTAERDVALLTCKGLTVAEIAELRNTSPGTVKSQNNAIYRKAGVKSRTQLLSLLIEDLLIVDRPPLPDAQKKAS